ncbi:hypothetical protein D3C78_1155380 [compost metagenome]
MNLIFNFLQIAYKFILINRFKQITVCPLGNCFFGVIKICVTAKNQNVKRRIMPSQQLNELQPIHAWHPNVSNNKVWLVLFIFLKGFVTISCDIYYGISESFPVQKYTKTFSQLRFVVYYKNFNHQ